MTESMKHTHDRPIDPRADTDPDAMSAVVGQVVAAMNAWRSAGSPGADDGDPDDFIAQFARAMARTSPPTLPGAGEQGLAAVSEAIRCAFGDVVRDLTPAEVRGLAAAAVGWSFIRGGT